MTRNLTGKVFMGMSPDYLFQSSLIRVLITNLKSRAKHSIQIISSQKREEKTSYSKYIIHLFDTANSYNFYKLLFTPLHLSVRRKFIIHNPKSTEVN